MYRIWPAFQCFQIKLAEVVDNSLSETFLAAFDHPENEPSFRSIIDMQGVKHFEISTQGIQKIANLVKGRRSRDYRAAHIVATKHQVGMSNMFAVIAEANGVAEVGQFYHFIDAVKWLDLPIRTGATPDLIAARLEDTSDMTVRGYERVSQINAQMLEDNVEVNRSCGKI